MVLKLRSDILLFLITITLIGMGILMIYSASAVFAKEYTGDYYYFLKRQICWVLIGSIGLFGAWKLDYHFFQKKSKFLFFLGLVLISLTIIPGLGHEINGATRWLKIGFFIFQPAELMRISFVIYLTDYILRRKNELQSLFKGFIPSLSSLIIVSIILLKQPHLGMIFLLCIITVSILFIGGAKIKHLICLGLISGVIFYFLIQTSQYRSDRWEAFLNPWKDPKGKGYHIIHSMIALGSGGLYGVGLGNSKLKLFYLPQSPTDFIFAVIGEEGGFLLTSLIIILFLVFTFVGCKISLSALDSYGSLLAIGITGLITLQSFLNIAVVTGVVATTGMPLPFISFGGSSLLINMIGVGIILNIAKCSLAQSYSSKLYQ